MTRLIIIYIIGETIHKESTYEEELTIKKPLREKLEKERLLDKNFSKLLIKGVPPRRTTHADKSTQTINNYHKEKPIDDKLQKRTIIENKQNKSIDDKTKQNMIRGKAPQKQNKNNKLYKESFDNSKSVWKIFWPVVLPLGLLIIVLTYIYIKI